MAIGPMGYVWNGIDQKGKSVESCKGCNMPTLLGALDCPQALLAPRPPRDLSETYVDRNTKSIVLNQNEYTLGVFTTRDAISF